MYLCSCKICCLDMCRIYNNRYRCSLFCTLFTNYSPHVFDTWKNETSVGRYDKIFTAVDTLKQIWHCIYLYNNMISHYKKMNRSLIYIIYIIWKISLLYLYELVAMVLLKHKVGTKRLYRYQLLYLIQVL